MKSALIAYGLEKLASVTGGNAAELLSALGEIPTVNWEKYKNLLGGTGQREEEMLSSIFSYVVLRNEEQPPLTYLAARPLALDDQTLFPVSLKKAKERSNWDKLWRGFVGEYGQLRKRLNSDEDAFFEGFYHLYHKYAWAVPCTYGERGVSLFQQWKAVAALVFATGDKWADGPAGDFTLIGGDIPGIQDFVYTITSKGAAKGLRGRSFFIQLLGDAVVRRILAKLELCSCNVVYNAGGNFMALGPKGDAEVGSETVQKRLEGLQKEVDGVLLDVFGGDLALCLAWLPLQADQVSSHEFANPVSKDLKGLIAEKKRQRFNAVAREHWKDLFGPKDKPGNRYCVICQRPLGRGEGIEMEGEGDLPPEERSRRCDSCDGFKKLAERIGQEGLLIIGREHPNGDGEPWQEALWRVSHVWYDYGLLEKPSPPSKSYLYTINDTNFLADYAHGFTFIANVTPRVTEADQERWKEKPEEGEEAPRLDGIRTFSQMADVARGVKRLGVLRMDVDDLGQIMVHGLEPRTLAATSTLSEALDRFFAGWLNQVCAEVNQLHRLARNGEDRSDRLYVIYAGGDDLFVVGSWDLMPTLAERVREQFKAYTGCNPALHISGGITLEGRKFPLYQAAERAGQAEDEAKKYSRNEVPKDAFNFLSLAVKWDEWVREVQPRLEAITDLVIPDKAPKALIQVLQNIHAQYEEQVKQKNKALRDRGEPLPDEPQYQVYYGPWMWREAYALTQMAERIRRAGDEEAAKAVLGLQVGAVSPVSIRYVGLAARWAELLTREEGET
jgi:CRISPR-associated protein Csm1